MQKAKCSNACPDFYRLRGWTSYRKKALVPLAGIEQLCKRLIYCRNSSGGVCLLTILLTHLPLSGDAQCGAMCSGETEMFRSAAGKIWFVPNHSKVVGCDHAVGSARTSTSDECHGSFRHFGPRIFVEMMLGFIGRNLRAVQ